MMNFQVKNLVFTAHNSVAILLLVTGVILGLNQYFETPVNCFGRDDIPERTVNNYCLQSLYSYADDGGPILRPDPSRSKISVDLYKWMPILLIALSLPFFAVTLLWFYLKENTHRVNDNLIRSGFSIDDLLGRGGRVGLRELAKNSLILLNAVYLYLATRKATKEGLELTFPLNAGCVLSKLGASGDVQKHSFTCFLRLSQYYVKVFLLLPYILQALALISAVKLTYTFLCTLPFIPILLARLVDPLYKSEELYEVASECSFGDWISVKHLMENMDPSEFAASLRRRKYSGVLSKQ